MRKIFFASLALLALYACDSKPKFNIQGEVSGADGKMIYFESSGLGSIVPLDSTKLKGDGSFEFNGDRPASPEFYRLRVGDQIINLSIDSTETINVKAQLGTFSTGYSVEGSSNCSKIKELSLKQIKLQNTINALAKSVETGKIGNDMYEAQVAELVKKFKDDVKINYIFAHPDATYSYFALFQKLNDYLIFDPLNSKDDIKCFGAVATSLDLKYPNSERSKNLYNIVIKGMRNTHAPQQKVLELPENKIQETGVIDISLRDLHGNIQRLTSLKGKVVLLDFTVYQSAIAAPHNLKLRELYSKYASQGFQIYQVSLDADEHFWKTSADNLPWICVRDENGINSSIASMYNVKKVPYFYIINRNNEIKTKSDNVKNIEAAVKALL
jgi:peroxiredoxin